MPPISNVYNEDCIIGMSRYSDKFFDLAIVDPPYGLQIAINGENSKEWGIDKERGFTFRAKKYVPKKWDTEKPGNEYFNELKRISKRQIIWGGNYFNLDMKYYIVWYKMGGSNNEKYSHTELAYLSFKANSKLFDFWWNGFGSLNYNEKRIHPTQKPKQLYKWLLQNFAKEGDKILDTHLGSQSSRIVAYKLGFDFWGFEIDKDYFDAGNRRFNEAISMPLFEELKQPKQSKLF